jgi:cation diffusion facilitator family transporter
MQVASRPSHTPQNVGAKEQQHTVRQVTWIGLGTNLALAVLKFVAGTWGHSKALVADAVHSISDTTTDLAVIIGSYFWARPPDVSHPYGHRRLETLVTLLIGFVLLAAGAGLCWEAIQNILVPRERTPGWLAAVAAGISILIKEILYRWTAHMGKRVKSPALAANAWHHRTDAISSLPVLLAIVGVMVRPEWGYLDHLGAVVVSLFIVHAALRIIGPGFQELIDAGASIEVCKRIMNIAYEDPAVKQVHGVRTRYVSSSLQVDLHVVVDGAMSVSEGHDIAEAVRARIIHKGPDVVDVVVHIEPLEAMVDTDPFCNGP